MVSCLMFKSLSHFKFIFGCGVSMCSKFTDLHVAVQLSQHHLLKSLSFLHCIFCPRRQSIYDIMNVILKERETERQRDRETSCD